MKRVVALIMVVVMLLLVFTACGGNTEKTESEIIPFSNDPDAMAYASKSVVKIKVYNKQNEYIASGSGFFAFDSKTVITNYHVIEDAYKIEIIDDDDKTLVISTIYNVDKDKDIAILQISDSISGYSPLKIASSDNVKKGENVVAIGSPLGLKNTISMGTISNFVEEDGIDMIQFTAAISNGSSGGALLNDSGEVIGITSASYIEGQNLNLAIPIAEIVSLYQKSPILKSVTEYYNEGILSFNSVAKLMEALKKDPSAYYNKKVKVLASVYKSENSKNDGTVTILDMSDELLYTNDRVSLMVALYSSIEAHISNDMPYAVLATGDYVELYGTIKTSNDELYLDDCQYDMISTVAERKN